MLRFLGVLISVAIVCMILAGCAHFGKSFLQMMAVSTRTLDSVDWAGMLWDACGFSMKGLALGMGAGLVAAVADHELWAPLRFKQQARKARHKRRRETAKTH